MALPHLVRVIFDDDVPQDRRHDITGRVAELVGLGEPLVFGTCDGFDIQMEYPSCRPNLTREEFQVRVVDRLMEAGEDPRGPVIAWAAYIATLLPSREESQP